MDESAQFQELREDDNSASEITYGEVEQRLGQLQEHLNRFAPLTVCNNRYNSSVLNTEQQLLHTDFNSEIWKSRTLAHPSCQPPINSSFPLLIVKTSPNLVTNLPNFPRQSCVTGNKRLLGAQQSPKRTRYLFIHTGWLFKIKNEKKRQEKKHIASAAAAAASTSINKSD